jgi:hypothetical protein
VWLFNTIENLSTKRSKSPVTKKPLYAACNKEAPNKEKTLEEETTMIATLNKSKTALTINRQEFKLALSKIGEGIDKQIASLKKAKQSYDAAEIAREVISEANIFEAIIEGFNEAEETNLKLHDITNLEVAQGWIDEFLEKYSAL